MAHDPVSAGYLELLTGVAERLGRAPHELLAESLGGGAFRRYVLDLHWGPWDAAFRRLPGSAPAPPVRGFVRATTPSPWLDVPAGYQLSTLLPLHASEVGVPLLVPSARALPDGAYVEVRDGTRVTLWPFRAPPGEAPGRLLVHALQSDRPLRLPGFRLYDDVPARLRDPRFLVGTIREALSTSTTVAEHVARAAVGSPGFDVRPPGLDARLILEGASATDAVALGAFHERLFPPPYRAGPGRGAAAGDRARGTRAEFPHGTVLVDDRIPADVTMAALRPGPGYRRIGAKRPHAEDNTLVHGDFEDERLTRLLATAHVPLLLHRDDVSIPAVDPEADDGDLWCAVMLRRGLDPGFTSARQAERMTARAADVLCETVETALPHGLGLRAELRRSGLLARLRAGLVQVTMAEARLDGRAILEASDLRAVLGDLADGAARLARDPYFQRATRVAEARRESAAHVRRRGVLQLALAGDDGLTLADLWALDSVRNAFPTPERLERFLHDLRMAGDVLENGGRHRWV